MFRCQMRFTEEHEDRSLGMTLPNLSQLQRGVAIACSNFPQILARHAIEAVESFGVIARAQQEFIERRPVIAPIQVEADALPKFRLFNLTTPPFVHNVLVAGKDSFQSQDHRTIPG